MSTLTVEEYVKQQEELKRKQTELDAKAKSDLAPQLETSLIAALSKVQSVLNLFTTTGVDISATIKSDKVKTALEPLTAVFGKKGSTGTPRTTKPFDKDKIVAILKANKNELPYLAIVEATKISGQTSRKKLENLTDVFIVEKRDDNGKVTDAKTATVWVKLKK